MQAWEHQQAAALKGGPVWLITFATYHRIPVFESPDLRWSCAEALRETCDRNGYRVYALAIMTDHVHLVLDAGLSDHTRPRVLNNVKGVASRRVFQASPELKLDLLSAHLWADEYQAQALPGWDAIERACRYVEENPRKLGLPGQRYPWLSLVRPAL